MYDEYSNVLSKEKISESGVPFFITRYEYDVLKRLSKESVSTISIDDSHPNDPVRSEELLYGYHYIYDSNGNIIEKKKTDSNDQVVYVDTYHYSTHIKDRLESISRYEDGVTTSIYSMTYSASEPFRPSTITEDGQTKYLVWHGPRLMNYGDYEYAYNEAGLRINKTGENFHIAYDVEDLMVIRSMDKVNDRVIDYHFDQHHQVIGFNYQGKEFLYQRDIVGEIYGIIDKNGKRFVTYSYTAYGVPTIEIPSGLTTLELSQAQAIRDLNIYLYKGYIYDQETGLYYCHTRYYNPRVGRWISIDDINYLDPGSIGGLNLYAYCGNNPVMYSDPNGYFPILISLAIIFGIGALSGVTGTFIGDLATSAMTGEWSFSSWETYVGAAIGYGAGAIAVTYFGPAAGLALGAGLATFTGMSLEKATGTSNASWGEIALWTGVSFGLGALMGHATKGLRISGITAGRGSFQHVMRTQFTNMIRHGYNISLKTAAKSYVAMTVSRQITGGAFAGVRRTAIEWWEYFMYGDSEGLRWV